MGEFYNVTCKCTQCGEWVSIRVPKGTLKAEAAKQVCPNCGVKGYIRVA